MEKLIMSDYETRVGNIRPTELSTDEVVYQWLNNNEKPKANIPKYATLLQFNIFLPSNTINGIMLNSPIHVLIKYPKVHNAIKKFPWCKKHKFKEKSKYQCYGN